MDISGIASVIPSRYDLDRFDIQTVLEDKRFFFKCLIEQKHLMYHWGYHVFFARTTAFLVDYDNKSITDKSGTPISDEQWTVCEPDELHELLRGVFVGEWGVTARDTIVRMENSGVRVDICGTMDYGPKNPKEFIEALRVRLKADQTASAAEDSSHG